MLSNSSTEAWTEMDSEKPLMSLPAREELKRTLRIAVLRTAPEARKKAAESMIITLNLGPRRPATTSGAAPGS